MVLTWPSLNFYGFCGTTASSSFSIYVFLPEGFGSNCFSRFRSASIVSSRSLSILMYGVEMELCVSKIFVLHAQSELMHEYQTKPLRLIKFTLMNASPCSTLSFCLPLLLTSLSPSALSPSHLRCSGYFIESFPTAPGCT